MKKEDFKDLFEKFLSAFDEEQSTRIWKDQSDQFRQFWSTRIMAGGKQLNDAELNKIILLLDKNAKGSTSETNAVAKAMIRQNKWHKMFRDLKQNDNLRTAVDSLFHAKSDDKKIALLNQIKELNTGSKNSMTGKSANAINAMLALYHPNQYSFIVSLKSRVTYIKNFGFEIPENFEDLSWGERIIESNKIYLNGFKALGITQAPRTVSEFSYYEPTRKLFALENTDEEEDNNDLEPLNPAKLNIVMANITWNSNDWQRPSEDKSGHGYIKLGNVPMESWNFDFENARNTGNKILGFCQWTAAPKVESDNTIVIFHSQGKIVGFYGRAKIFKKHQMLKNKIVYNLEGDKNLSIVLTNKLEQIKDKGYLEDKLRMGQNGFIYLSKAATVLKMIKEAIELNPELIEKLTHIENWINSFKEAEPTRYKMNSLNQIFFGPPGTGKTYNTVNQALEILGVSTLDKTRQEVKRLFDEKVKEGQIVFTTFHQSMSYEDFIEGIKPQPPEERGQSVTYEIEDGIFKRICIRATFTTGNFEAVLEQFKASVFELDGKAPLRIVAPGTTFDITYRGTNVFYVQPLNTVKSDPWYPVNIDNIRKAFETENFDGIYNQTYVREVISHLKKNYKLEKATSDVAMKNKNYVLIIDEINRGNIAQIFGELITLIEEDKRLGASEFLEVILPYSKTRFGVPPNLYIIGTMNTADRSVEALDTALRRRFSFKEMLPDENLIEKYGILKDSQGKVDNIHLGTLLRTINIRIEKILDKDHLIGHSYFMDVSNLRDLMTVFQNKVIPLLQEYFYGDYGKIGLVLGSGFVNQVALQNGQTESIFANFAEYDSSELLERKVYHLNSPTRMSEEDFKAAIDKLLGK